MIWFLFPAQAQPSLAALTMSPQDLWFHLPLLMWDSDSRVFLEMLHSIELNNRVYLFTAVDRVGGEDNTQQAQKHYFPVLKSKWLLLLVYPLELIHNLFSCLAEWVRSFG